MSRPAEEPVRLLLDHRSALGVRRCADRKLWWGVIVVPADDEELLARQSALQAEAQQLLADLRLSAAFSNVGPLVPTGSYVSELMCWRDLDLGLLVGADFTPRDVLMLLSLVVDLPDVTGFDYRDERGVRSPTGDVRDERYHLPIRCQRDGALWRIDLTLWLHDPHLNVRAWHLRLRDRVTAEQRSAILRIKDVWHRLPSYPDQVSGWEIYNAVLDDDVRTPAEFATWLTDHGFVTT
jgi:hypothetical protein